MSDPQRGQPAIRLEDANSEKNMTVYARLYQGSDVIETVKHADGRVGLYSPVRQAWVEVWGIGESHGAFRNNLADHKNLTEDGRRVLGIK
jgi:hypothetical protein